MRGLYTAFIPAGVGKRGVDESVEGNEVRHGFFGAVEEVSIEPVAQNRLGFAERRCEIRREGEAMQFLVLEWSGKRVGLEDEIKRVGFERFYFELGADAQGGGALPEMRPGEKIVRAIAGPDNFGFRGDVKLKMINSKKGAVAGAHIKQVGRIGDLAGILVSGEVGDFELHSKKGESGRFVFTKQVAGRIGDFWRACRVSTA